MNNKYEVACYHWSNWHRYGGNDVKRGEGWTEWEYLKNAIPRFVNHKQPKKPLWGYLDDAKIETAELQIGAAADHGITSFIFDWGWTKDDGFGGHGNNLALEQGFLQAGNRDRLKFGLMWCGGYAIEAFDYIIDSYFTQPNYWRVDGGLYISIYQLDKFIESNGGIEETAKALNNVREKTRAAGLGEIHLAAIEFGLNQFKDASQIIKKLSIDSVTSYVWAHNTTPEGLYGPYEKWSMEAMGLWSGFAEKYQAPYLPNISMGWDQSPRCHPTMQYKIGGPLLYHTLQGTYENVWEPYLSSIVIENTPEQFKNALINAREYVDSTNGLPGKIVTIYAWNEWTEGGYLEPEEQYGMGYLEAIRDVFGE